MKPFLIFLSLGLFGCANAQFDRTYSISFVDQSGAALSASATFGASKAIKLPKPTKK